MDGSWSRAFNSFLTTHLRTSQFLLQTNSFPKEFHLTQVKVFCGLQLQILACLRQNTFANIKMILSFVEKLTFGWKGQCLSGDTLQSRRDILKMYRSYLVKISFHLWGKEKATMLAHHLGLPAAPTAIWEGENLPGPSPALTGPYSHSSPCKPGPVFDPRTHLDVCCRTGNWNKPPNSAKLRSKPLRKFFSSLILLHFWTSAHSSNF